MPNEPIVSENNETENVLPAPMTRKEAIMAGVEGVTPMTREEAILARQQVKAFTRDELYRMNMLAEAETEEETEEEEEPTG